MTLEDYNKLLKQQGGICAICNAYPTRLTRLQVDHDHITGRVRGLLCLSCNLKLGWYERHSTKLTAYLRLAKITGGPHSATKKE